MVFSCLRFEITAAAAGPRLGLIVPRGFGNAVQRNRLKRWLREAFRARRADLPALDIVAMPRHGVREATWEKVDADWSALLAKLARRAAS